MPQPCLRLAAPALLVAQATSCLPSTEVHYEPPTQPDEGALILASYEHGPLRLGPCGPYREGESYLVDLYGDGPRYDADHVTVHRDGKPLAGVVGSVTITPDRRWATIDLAVMGANGATRRLPIDGRHALH